MRIADQFQKVKDGETQKNAVIMVCAIWEMTPRRQVYIGAADVEALAEVWHEITGTRIDRNLIQDVKVSSK